MITSRDHSVVSSLRHRHGVATTAELHADGWGRGAIAAAISSRDIVRARQGWYILPDLDPALLRCVRVGGAATCVTGLALHGCWTPASTAVHVLVPHHDARLRDPRHSKRRRDDGSSVRVHWRGTARHLLSPMSRLIADPLECLRDAVSCAGGESLLAMADAIRCRFAFDDSQWHEFAASLPARPARIVARASAARESGTESLLFFRLSSSLERAGIPIRSQVSVPGVGRVDFVIGERLIVEVDGARYHTDRERFESDRRRDALASTSGLRALRFSYHQLTERWSEVESAIWAAIARGDHG